MRRPLAGAGGRRRDHRAWVTTRCAASAIAMGERTPLALLDARRFGSHGGGRGDHQPGRGRCRRHRPHQALGQLDGAAGHGNEDAELFDTVRGRRPRFLSLPSASRYRSARIRCRCAPSLATSRAKPKQRDRAAVPDRHRLRRGRRRAPHIDARAEARCGGRRDRTAADRPRHGTQPARRPRPGASVWHPQWRPGAGCRSRSAQGLLCGDTRAESRRAASSPITTVPTAACSRRCAK
jgi:hypothetical protein